jgi:hypothetical protein
VRLVYDSRGLPGVMTARSEVARVLQIDTRADPCSFTGAYESVEMDTTAYESGTWVHTHDAWVI